MALERIHHLIVVTDDGKVAGIVSSLDVMSWLARDPPSDSYPPRHVPLRRDAARFRRPFVHDSRSLETCASRWLARKACYDV